ncbi:MAG: type II toxin-antitoxin system PemK/MazF family toxin [Oscillospiraceae bacterium]|nr:type II toxin-antitoxin system PemK/MazF family toxin [Oscillospiraceae bacterium]
MKLKQGDIIKLDFTPQAGREQAGYRPAVVVSCALFNKATQMPVLCPITNTQKSFPLLVPLDNRTETTGFILCQQIKATDVEFRGYTYIETLPRDILIKVLNIVRQEFDLDN